MYNERRSNRDKWMWCTWRRWLVEQKVESGRQQQHQKWEKSCMQWLSLSPYMHILIELENEFVKFFCNCCFHSSSFLWIHDSTINPMWSFYRNYSNFIISNDTGISALSQCRTALCTSFLPYYSSYYIHFLVWSFFLIIFLLKVRFEVWPNTNSIY